MVHMSNHRTWIEIISADPEHSRRYANRWRGFVRQGRDIDGEARLADAMAPRHARILDAGCGQGRVGGYLARVGHTVVGVDVDPYLIEEAKSLYGDSNGGSSNTSGPTWLVGDLAELPRVLQGGGVAETFDLIICPGNVLTFVADADRATVLEGFASALDPEGGRAIVGFGAGRGWEFGDFVSAARAAGLKMTQKYATWDLRPFEEDSQFLVAVLEKA
nr:class I SAM-dependent methyltransferase [Corynebacterium lactis]